MEDEMNQSPTPRFGKLIDVIKLSDNTYIKQLLKTEKKIQSNCSEIRSHEKPKISKIN